MQIMRLFANMWMPMKISSTYKYLQKLSFLGQKWVSLALFSILSVHPAWFYPSLRIDNRSSESQYFGQKIKIFSFNQLISAKELYIYVTTMHN